mmetsp:Transcript_30975/g.77959  ORF Transcript_30975/g.77959 Transcript_30975/m.77959 type:complete len:258 (+) Transcript_30975:1419-2192(+)
MSSTFSSSFFMSSLNPFFLSAPSPSHAKLSLPSKHFSVNALATSESYGASASATMCLKTIPERKMSREMGGALPSVPDGKPSIDTSSCRGYTSIWMLKLLMSLHLLRRAFLRSSLSFDLTGPPIGSSVHVRMQIVFFISLDLPGTRANISCACFSALNKLQEDVETSLGENTPLEALRLTGLRSASSLYPVHVPSCPCVSRVEMKGQLSSWIPCRVYTPDSLEPCSSQLKRTTPTWSFSPFFTCSRHALQMTDIARP